MASISVGLCAFWSERLESKALVKTIEDQRKAGEETLRESEVRYNNAMLVQEIGQATSTIMDIDKLIKAVLAIIEKRLDFDRGMIMLATRDRQTCNTSTGTATRHRRKIILRQTQFSLNNPNPKAFSYWPCVSAGPF